MQTSELPPGINVTPRGLKETRIEVQHLKWEIQTFLGSPEKLQALKDRLDRFLQYEQFIASRL